MATERMVPCDARPVEPLEENKEGQSPVLPEVTREHQCLGEIVGEVSLALNVTPITASITIEHVFQALVRQFYEKGMAYFPNFGYIEYQEGEVFFSPSPAMHETLSKMDASLISEHFTLALIEKRIQDVDRLHEVAGTPGLG